MVLPIFPNEATLYMEHLDYSDNGFHPIWHMVQGHRFNQNYTVGIFGNLMIQLQLLESQFFSDSILNSKSILSSVKKGGTTISLLLQCTV